MWIAAVSYNVNDFLVYHLTLFVFAKKQTRKHSTVSASALSLWDTHDPPQIDLHREEQSASPTLAPRC